MHVCVERRMYHDLFFGVCFRFISFSFASQNVCTPMCTIINLIQMDDVQVLFKLNMCMEHVLCKHYKRIFEKRIYVQYFCKVPNIRAFSCNKCIWLSISRRKMLRLEKSLVWVRSVDGSFTLWYNCHNLF